MELPLITGLVLHFPLPKLAIIIFTIVLIQILFVKEKISKENAKFLATHLEFIGVILIGFSFADTGIFVGGYPVVAKVIDPFFGTLFVLVAYHLRIRKFPNGNNGSDKDHVFEINEESLKSVYASEIKRLCKYALRSHEEAINAYARKDIDEFWFHIRCALNFAADVSKFFFPAKPAGSKHIRRSKNRAKQLKAIFKVTKASSIRPRFVRNHLVHIDEYFDDWVTKPKPAIFLGNTGNVPLEDAIAVKDQAGNSIPFDKKMKFYYYDKYRNTVSFHELEVQLDPLVDELKRLREAVL